MGAFQLFKKDFDKLSSNEQYSVLVRKLALQRYQKSYSDLPRDQKEKLKDRIDAKMTHMLQRYSTELTSAINLASTDATIVDQIKAFTSISDALQADQVLLKEDKRPLFELVEGEISDLKKKRQMMEAKQTKN